MNVLVTGIAGFIGHAVAKRLAVRGLNIIGVDNLNDYYDPALKTARLDDLREFKNVRFEKMDLADTEAVQELFRKTDFDYVIHLAAQAGVRYSIDNPMVYIQSNVVGFLNILEGCRAQKDNIKHFAYASSSSVYGLNEKTPFAVEDNVDKPVSLYAATKKSNELMMHTYAHLYGIPATGLRFFTVYGPWGRPDMAMFKFTKAIFEGKKIDVFNHGDLSRDFTYIDDIVDGIEGLLPHPPTAEPPCRVVNIGHGSPVRLMDFIQAVEDAAGKKAEYNYLPMQAGDVPQTWADTDALFEITGVRPKVGVKEGAAKFVEWYKSHYQG